VQTCFQDYSVSLVYHVGRGWRGSDRPGDELIDLRGCSPAAESAMLREGPVHLSRPWWWQDGVTKPRLPPGRRFRFPSSSGGSSDCHPNFPSGSSRQRLRE